MDDRLKQRLVGALVLVVAAVIFLPMVFGPAEEDTRSERAAPAGEAASISAPSTLSTPLPLPAPVREEGPLAGNVAPTAATKVAPPAPAAGPTLDQAPGAGDYAYAVQLASFSDARNAKALERRLAQKGYAAFTSSADGGSQSLTRVYVGPLGDAAEAKSMRERLRRETKLEGLVVRYPKP